MDFHGTVWAGRLLVTTDGMLKLRSTIRIENVTVND